MTEKQKILQVLKKIKDRSEISPDPELVMFPCSTVIIGLLTCDEERMILGKLAKDEVIEIHRPKGRDPQEEAIFSVLITLVGLLVCDWLLAWRNLKGLLVFLHIL